MNLYRINSSAKEGSYEKIIIYKDVVVLFGNMYDGPRHSDSPGGGQR
jgi:hypothetical protein